MGDPLERSNVDQKVVEDFGLEWEKFNQQELIKGNIESAFNEYFSLFPFHLLKENSVGFDMGCGSGRWAAMVAPKVGLLNCVDPSLLALTQAKINLKSQKNCNFECAPIHKTSLEDESQDFGYCLGVLHHIPDTISGLKVCTKKLKKGAPLLIYLYYNFDNRPLWFRMIWKATDYLRKFLSRLPFFIKYPATQVIAGGIYYPLAKISYLLSTRGINVSNFPLSTYKDKSFYFMRTDALDRFGTKLEKRFSKKEIYEMMVECDLRQIVFNESAPFWVALGYKK
jgi:ubiquinone/menaquinone biosynthesis C-methylase UbiE